MKAIGYIRVSTEDQKESGLSLEHQKAKIEAYSLAMDIEIVEVIEDAASAKNMNRIGLNKAFNMLKNKEADAIVILKLDRLTRSVKDLGIIVEMFDKSGTALISVQDSINTTTAAGRLVLNVLGSVAQWEREAIAERTSAALQVKKSHNELVGDIPFGYELSEDGIHLIENSREKEAIAIMQELRSRGLSFRKIISELESKNISAKKGGKWYPMTIKNILEAR
jgi:site-specific DNA recombinase